MTEQKYAEYEITVRIRVTVSEPFHRYDDPAVIAQNYAEMALNYRSIGATEARVVEIERVTK